MQNTFGVVPRIGWSIDPFGHSAGHAYLLSMMGYNASFIERIHFAELEERMKMKNLEFYWNAVSNYSIFTHINPLPYYKNLLNIETVL